MKLEIISKQKDSIRFKMVDERHTISQMLKNELLLNKDVSMASYMLAHPEENECTFYVKVKDGKDVNKALTTAIDSLIEQIKDFEKNALAVLPKDVVKTTPKKKETKTVVAKTKEAPKKVAKKSK